MSKLFGDNPGEERYLELLNRIMVTGTDKTDRTGIGTRSIFGAQLRFDLYNEGFPLLTTKKLFTKGIFAELCWLISGDTNIRSLQAQGVHIWDEWADENGELGPVYGKQWRAFRDGVGRYCGPECKTPHMEVDQLQNAVDMIKTNPDSRRIIVTAWNPGDVPHQALPPCHLLYQFEVHNNKLSCHMYQRSADVFLGVPFNIASYAALTHVVARWTGLSVGDLIISFGDVHIYNNHFIQVKEQLTRSPRPFPTLELGNSVTTIENGVNTSNFLVNDYEPHPAIKAKVAV